MKLAYDLVSAVDIPGGIRTYVLELLRCLLTTREIERISSFLPSNRRRRWLNLFESERDIPEESKGKLQIRSFPIPLSPLIAFWQTARIPSGSFLFGEYDVYHAPHQLFPPPSDRPTVMTIHDMARLRYPESYPALTRFLYDRRYRYLDRVSHFLAVSDFTKRELCELLGVAEARVTVTHLAARADFAPLDPDGPRLRESLRALGLRKGFVLCVSGLGARKNVELLLRAYRELQARHKDFPMLVLAGPMGPHESELMESIERLGLSGGIRVLGFQSVNRLVDLYNGAGAFVYPSVYEGFGLPVVEAMKCGAPAVVADIPVMREVVADAGLFFDPRDPDDLVRALDEVVSNSSRGRELRERGLKRAGDFSWAKCGSETFSVYRNLAG